MGVFAGLQAAAALSLGANDLHGIRVAIQGVGHVGQCLVEHLVNAGAQIWVSDVVADRVNTMVERYPVKPVGVDEIYGLEVEVFAPCALGAVLNDQTIPLLKAKIIAGAANNQLAETRHAAMLQQRGILYIPDFAINAGGGNRYCLSSSRDTAILRACSGLPKLRTR